MLEDYKKQEEERQKVSKETAAFYKTVDLPGSRVFDSSVIDARKRVAELIKERSRPNHD